MTNAITPIVGTAAADKLSGGSTGDDTLHGGGGPALVDMTKLTIVEDGAGNRITLARLPENPNQCSRVARPARSSQTTEMDGPPSPTPPTYTREELWP